MSRKFLPKILLFLFAALSLSAAEEISYCQMLLSEAEQKVQGFDRQRKMYLPERAKRLSIMAVRDGSELLRKNKLSEAMAEFNRAWRFAPANPYSYWMAAIVRSMEAMQATRNEVKKTMFRGQSQTLGKMSSAASGIPKRSERKFRFGQGRNADPICRLLVRDRSAESRAVFPAGRCSFFTSSSVLA